MIGVKSVGSDTRSNLSTWSSDRLLKPKLQLFTSYPPVSGHFWPVYGGLSDVWLTKGSCGMTFWVKSLASRIKDAENSTLRELVFNVCLSKFLIYWSWISFFLGFLFSFFKCYRSPFRVFSHVSFVAYLWSRVKWGFKLFVAVMITRSTSSSIGLFEPKCLVNGYSPTNSTPDGLATQWPWRRKGVSTIRS